MEDVAFDKQGSGLYLVNVWTVIRRLVYWVVLPTAAMLHFLFLAMNQDTITVNFGFRRGAYSKAVVLAGCMLYGFSMAATLFWIMQFRYQLRKDALSERVRELECRVDSLKAENALMQRATSRITVPYRVDALLKKGLEDFAGTTIPAAHSTPMPR